MRHASWLVAIVLGLRAASMALAAPSTSAPELPLLVRPDEINMPLLERAVAIDQMARQTVEQLEARPVPAQFTAAEVAQVGQGVVACYFLNAFGKQLGDRCEAAGFDYQLRQEGYRKRIDIIVDKWRKAPGYRQDDLHRLAKQVHDAGVAQLPGLEARIQQGELEAVERVLLGTIAELSRYTVWLGSSGNPYLIPFNNLLLNKVEPPLHELRIKRTVDDLTAVLAQATVNFEDLPAQLARARADVGRVGVAPWGSESLGGPDIIGRVGDEWRRVQIRAQRMVLAEAARRITHGPVPLGAEKTISALGNMQQQLLAGLSELVKADTARVPAAEAPALYERYVAEIARLAQLGQRDEIRAALEPVLVELAAKEPGFKTEVESYATATTELLRWRRRVAAAQARHRLRNALTPAGTLLAIGRKQNTPGLFVVEAGGFHSALLDSAPAVLGLWRERAIGRQVTAIGVTGLGGGKSIGMYQGRTYARFTLPISTAVDNETRAIKQALLVSPGRPALSLDAALAIAAADAGNYAHVGGSLTELTLEPVLTRFLLLSDRSVGLLPVGPLPPEPLLFDMRPQVMVRFDLAPSWVGHECFVVDLAP
ncbi:MAG: hypothetical protein SFU86_24265 [Pirellulaceae bacterium]|nr:hypothetical protein [Pirellulaceae bacterium]